MDKPKYFSHRRASRHSIHVKVDFKRHKKTYIYISFVFLPLIIFLIQKFPVNTISTSKSEWFYSLVFMPKHDSYFHNIINNENVGINRIH